MKIQLISMDKRESPRAQAMVRESGETNSKVRMGLWNAGWEHLTKLHSVTSLGPSG